jgi:hypothetical protein
VDRVLASEAKGRGFDPRQPRQYPHWFARLKGAMSRPQTKTPTG